MDFQWYLYGTFYLSNILKVRLQKTLMQSYSIKQGFFGLTWNRWNFWKNQHCRYQSGVRLSTNDTEDDDDDDDVNVVVLGAAKKDADGVEQLGTPQYAPHDTFWNGSFNTYFIFNFRARYIVILSEG